MLRHYRRSIARVQIVELRKTLATACLGTYQPTRVVELKDSRSDMNVLATEEGAGPCPLSSTEWLAAAPRGAYTTARTVQGASVFELSFHIDRLSTSSRIMLETDAAEGRPNAAAALERYAPAVAAPTLRPLVVSRLCDAVTAYRTVSGDAEGEIKLTVLVTWPTAEPDSGIAVLVHASPLGPHPSPPVKVHVHGSPRHNAAAKDSDWVRERKALEASAPADVNEVLLFDPGTGAVMEGLSSNFFAIIDGRLRTAGEGVLAGSVRAAVLRVAEQEGIPVDLTAPLLSEIDRWEGAFLSSTSRLLLPIDHVAVPGATPPLERSFPRTPLTAKLEEAVAQEVLAASEPLFD